MCVIVLIPQTCLYTLGIQLFACTGIIILPWTIDSPMNAVEFIWSWVGRRRTIDWSVRFRLKYKENTGEKRRRRRRNVYVYAHIIKQTAESAFDEEWKSEWLLFLFFLCVINTGVTDYVSLGISMSISGMIFFSFSLLFTHHLNYPRRLCNRKRCVWLMLSFLLFATSRTNQSINRSSLVLLLLDKF